MVDPASLLPVGRRSYDGSLTTPPCTEGVRWVVLVDPVELSPRQIERLRSRHHPNSRPLQARHGRRFLVDASPGFGSSSGHR